MIVEPYYANRRAVLLEGVRQILADREAAYPPLVERGKMTQDQADAGLRIARAMVADWQRICDLYAGRPAAPRDASAAPAEKRDTCAYILARAEAMVLKVRDAYWRALPASARRDLLDDTMSFERLRDHWKAHHIGYGDPAIGIFMAEYRRWRIASALLWHAEPQRETMRYAELNAAMIERFRPAADRAA